MRNGHVASKGEHTTLAELRGMGRPAWRCKWTTPTYFIVSKETLAVSYSADPIIIGFNGNYFGRIPENGRGKGARRLSLKDAHSAGLLVTESMNPEFQQQYVVMPMRAA